jgi:hypothetical protein
MSDVEKIHVKLGISGTYWDKRPKYRVLFNDEVIKESEITLPLGEVEYLEFDSEYSTDTATIKIQLLNKENSDTVQSAIEGDIIQDMLLNIVSMEVDEIDLGQILFEDSDYVTDFPVEFAGETTQLVKRCVNLGWNGTWSLTWNNPFYIWLLEKI